MRVLAVLFLLVASPAFAQPGATDERARELYLLGDDLYSQGRYEEALAAFEEAYRLSERPLLLFNIANAQERSGQWQGAIESLEGYLPHADEAERAAQTTSERIEEANALLARARILARAGYARVDSRTDAILSALFDNGLFEAGTVLVGSHAYGALLNELGVRAAGYATNDVDLARPRSLALPELRSFEEMLKDSGLELLPVSQFGKKPPTSFKPAGADPLRIDLLAPTRRTSIGVLAIPELSAHATALPHFAWLLEHVEHSVVLGKSSVIPVNVPRPEIFAWHKMVLSQLRSRSRDKVQKDRMQAAVLFAALAALEPSALEASYSGLSRPTRSLVKASARHVAERLMTSKHESAAALLQELAG